LVLSSNHGTIRFGAAADVSLTRASSNQLSTPNEMAAADFTSAAAIGLKLTNSAGAINFGPSADVNLYRGGASQLKTDSSLVATDLTISGSCDFSRSSFC